MCRTAGVGTEVGAKSRGGHPLRDGHMRTTIASGVLALLGLSTLAAPARADEEKIALEKVPKAVMKAFKARFPKAQIKAAIKEEEDGETVYEIESTLKDMTVDAVLTAEGEFVEVEQEIEEDDLPAPVAKALAAKYPGAKIAKIEAVTKGKRGKPVYEIALEAEVVFNAKGKAVEVEDDEKPAAKGKKSKEMDDDEDDDEKESKTKVKAKKTVDKADKDDDDKDGDDEEMKGKKPKDKD